MSARGLTEARLHNARVHAVADALCRDIPIEQLRLTGVCKRCFHTRTDMTVEEAKSFNLGYVLVSPNGTIHIQSYVDDSTETACGVEAAETDWWWPI